VASVGWVYFIAGTKGGSVSWVTRMWEGQRHPPETENDIKINLLPFIFQKRNLLFFTTTEIGVSRFRNYRHMSITSNSQSLAPQ